MQAIVKHRVTEFFLPPTVIYRLLDIPDLQKKVDFSSLKYFLYGAAPMSVEKLKQAIAVFGPVMAGMRTDGYHATANDRVAVIPMIETVQAQVKLPMDPVLAAVATMRANVSALGQQIGAPVDRQIALLEGAKSKLKMPVDQARDLVAKVAQPAEDLVAQLLAAIDAQAQAVMGAMAPGDTPALASAQAQLAQQTLPVGLRWQALPFLSQPAFDRLLWASDLNLVRGEDSLVRALWAGKPLVWQIYPQDDAAHVHKLNAFLDAIGASASLRSFHHAWNDAHPTGSNVALPLSDLNSWSQSLRVARERLLQMDDLVTQLVQFVLNAQSVFIPEHIKIDSIHIPEII